jgi:hypothetical protein
MRRLTGLWVLSAISTLACGGGGDVNIGDGDGEPTQSLGASLVDYGGSWEGYVEGHTFPDGTDRVRLTLDAEGNGTLMLGNDTDPLPAPDPDAAPPGWGDATTIPHSILVGYPFEIASATLESKRIKLATHEPEPYQEWCNLQTPVLDETNPSVPNYLCARNVGYISTDGDVTCRWVDTNESVPCAKLACYEMCSCTATLCSWRGRYAPSLDAALDAGGEALVGTLVASLPSTDDSVTVRLERQ